MQMMVGIFWQMMLIKYKASDCHNVFSSKLVSSKHKLRREYRAVVQVLSYES